MPDDFIGIVMILAGLSKKITNLLVNLATGMALPAILLGSIRSGKLPNRSPPTLTHLLTQLTLMGLSFILPKVVSVLFFWIPFQAFPNFKLQSLCSIPSNTQSALLPTC